MNKVKEVLLSFWNDNKVKIYEAFKAFVRYVVFLTIGWAISYVGKLEQTSVTFVIFSFLTFIDKWLHENWKENERAGIKGLLPF